LKELALWLNDQRNRRFQRFNQAPRKLAYGTTSPWPLEHFSAIHGEQVITIAVIKGAHSLIFLSMAASILYTLYSGVMNRISRLTVISIGAVMAEGLVLLLNNMRCPLTDVVEDLGSTHGSVSDIFLPDWFAERIPVLFTPPFAVGLAAISLRRVRRQPLVAAICATVACLFLMGPWLFRKTDRAHSLR